MPCAQGVLRDCLVRRQPKDRVLFLASEEDAIAVDNGNHRFATFPSDRPAAFAGHHRHSWRRRFRRRSETDPRLATSRFQHGCILGAGLQRPTGHHCLSGRTAAQPGRRRLDEASGLRRSNCRRREAPILDLGLALAPGHAQTGGAVCRLGRFIRAAVFAKPCSEGG